MLKINLTRREPFRYLEVGKILVGKYGFYLIELLFLPCRNKK